MTAFVLDVSLTLTWFFPDEATPATWALLRTAVTDGAVVPDIWTYELANVLATALRRSRATNAEVAGFRRRIATIPIARDPRGGPADLDDLLTLAAAHRLSAYDAAYLELALRAGLPLATLDRDLAAAARKAGVAVLPEG